MSKTDTGSDTPTQPESPGPDSIPQVEAGENHDDANIVDWNGPHDITNPQNWPSRKKWAHVIMVSLFALFTNMAPTMCVPGINALSVEFHVTSPSVSTLAVTIYVLGLAIGPMVTSPLSETYGRLPVYHTANVGFLAFIIGCALSQNLAEFMVFRFISGFMGGTPMALGGGTIADVTRPEGRSTAMALFSLGPLAGPVLGPVLGGFLAGGLNWRWTFWLLAMLAGAVYLMAAIFLCETHAQTLLDRKTAGLRESHRNPHLRSKLETTSQRFTIRRVLVNALIRPTKLLIRSPILLVISVYVALVFGTLYLLFTTFTDVFEGQYGFITTTSGLSFLGLGISLTAAMVTFRVLSGPIQQWRMKAEGVQTPTPEYRLVTMIIFSPFVSLGLILYGWSAYYEVFWIVPIIGTSLIGFGAFFVLVSPNTISGAKALAGPDEARFAKLPVQMPAQLYLVDLFGAQAAASALSANNLLRFVFSTFLPLAGPPMYSSLGYGWGNTLLGFLALAFVPFPILFYKYGERLRAGPAKL